MEQKITAERAQELAQLHADGVSMRTLAKLYGVSLGLVHRHIHRANGNTAERLDPDVRQSAPTGAVEPDVRPRRQHEETEFPSAVAGFEPDDARASESAIILEPSPADRRRAAAERRARDDERRELEREADLVRREEELVAAVKAAKPGTPEWRHARRTLKRFRDGRRRFLPLPSLTGVQLSEQTLRDHPRPRLWENPYGP